MGNGSLCNNNRDLMLEQKFTVQNSIHPKEELTDNNGMNNINSDTSDYYIKNSRKWFKAALKKEDNPIYISNNTFKEEYICQNKEDINKIKNRIFFLPYGDKYEGEVVNNQPNGKGKYFTATGEIREGPFINGKLNGKGKMNLPNGIFLHLAHWEIHF